VTMNPTFSDIADEQGWDDEERIRHLIEFIASRGLAAELADHAKAIAIKEDDEWRASQADQ
jgi:hypothetical protein